MSVPSQFVTMFYRTARTGAFSVFGDTVQGISGKRLIIDRFIYSVEADAVAQGGVTIDMRKWMQGAQGAFWAKWLQPGEHLDSNELINIILKENETFAPVWSDGISGYFTVTWRICNVS